MGTYGIYMIITSLFGFISGVLGSLLYFKSKKKEAEGNAKLVEQNANSVEIRNVSDVTKLLIESITEFEKKLDEYRTKLDEQDQELRCMKGVLDQIKLLAEQINSENAECIAQQIKKLTNVK